jgi:hypothetical protein
MGIDSRYATFVTFTYAPMCIFVGECPTIGGFYANYFGWMATNEGLD